MQAEKTTVETELKKDCRRDGKDTVQAGCKSRRRSQKQRKNLVQAKVEEKYTVPEYEDPHQIYVREMENMEIY